MKIVVTIAFEIHIKISLKFKHREISWFSNPNAATVLIEVNTSSAIDPAFAYLICSLQQALDAL